MIAVLILVASLGAALLIGALSLAIILAQVIALLLAAFAPAALIAGAIPGRGHELFTRWGGALAGSLVAKAVLSLILAVVVGVAGAVQDATQSLGFLLAFTLVSAFYWTVFAQRRLLWAAVGSGAGLTLAPQGLCPEEAVGPSKSACRSAAPSSVSTRRRVPRWRSGTRQHGGEEGVGAPPRTPALPERAPTGHGAPRLSRGGGGRTTPERLRPLPKARRLRGRVRRTGRRWLGRAEAPRSESWPAGSRPGVLSGESEWTTGRGEPASRTPGHEPDLRTTRHPPAPEPPRGQRRARVPPPPTPPSTRGPGRPASPRTSPASVTEEQ